VRGFTLVEVLVALAILSVAVAGSARLFSLAVVTTSRARTQTSATTLAMQKLDELRALRWAGTPGSPSLPATDTQTDLTASLPLAGGVGLATSPADSLDANEAGYVDYLDRNGQWVGSGVTPPASAVFVRRWNIAGRAGDEANTLVLQVLVTTAAGAAAQSGVASRVRLPGDALLVGVRTRVGP
jgi:prepilin-type N-terminal cleavage/methylation domain-containing protein